MSASFYTAWPLWGQIFQGLHPIIIFRPLCVYKPGQTTGTAKECLTVTNKWILSAISTQMFQIFTFQCHYFPHSQHPLLKQVFFYYYKLHQCNVGKHRVTLTRIIILTWYIPIREDKDFLCYKYYWFIIEW